MYRSQTWNITYVEAMLALVCVVEVPAGALPPPAEASEYAEESECALDGLLTKDAEGSEGG